MGTNMKKALTTLLCLLFCITISAQDKAADLSKLVGDWSFSAPDAPYGYQDSREIQENEEVTALWYCEFLLTSRQKLQKDVYSNRNHVLRHCRRVFLS